MTIDWVLPTKKSLWNSIVKTCFYFFNTILLSTMPSISGFKNTDISRILSGRLEVELVMKLDRLGHLPHLIGLLPVPR